MDILRLFSVFYFVFIFKFLKKILGKKLIIFGGMNNQKYLGSDLFIIDLDVNYKFQKEMELEEIKSSNGKQSKLNKKSYEGENPLPAIK